MTLNPHPASTEDTVTTPTHHVADVLDTVDVVLSTDPSGRGATREQRRTMTADLFELRDVGTPLDGMPDARELVQIEDRLVRVNLRVAEAVAHRYAHRGVPVEDLEQVAAVALLQAIRRFDAHRSDDFLTYAVPTIRGTVQRHFRDRGWMVRPPRAVQELQSRVVQTRDSLAAHSGGEPSADEIGRALGVPAAEVREALQASGCFQPMTLDLPGAGADHLAGGQAAADLDAAEARAVLGPLVRTLPDVDRAVLHLRFFEELSQREIGQRLGMSQTQVSRQLDRILRDLHERTGSATA